MFKKSFILSLLILTACDPFRKIYVDTYVHATIYRSKKAVVDRYDVIKSDDIDHEEILVEFRPYLDKNPANKQAVYNDTLEAILEPYTSPRFGLIEVLDNY